MNTVNIIGRLTKDAEIRTTSSGKPVCNFCLAVDGGKDTTYFIDCTAWNATAERISSTVHKGDKIAITGMLTTRSWQTSDGQNRKETEVLALAFDYCQSKKQEEATAPAEPEDDPTSAPDPAPAEQPAGELPFEI